MSRPALHPVEPTKYAAFRCDRRTLNQLDKVAAQLGLTRSGAVRVAIEMLLAQTKRELQVPS